MQIRKDGRMNTLSEKVCIVTGASSGIGEATALALGGRGAKVALAARRADRLENLADRIRQAGGEALPVVCDVVDRGHVKSMVEKTMQGWGRIDVLINNAGIMPLAPLAKCRMDEWDAMIDLNIRGLLYGIGFVLPIMLSQKSGHIVNVSSVAGRRVFPGGAVYCGTKYAVHAISEGLRSELSERATEDGNQIRVTIIAPGVVMTELPDSIRDEETREATRQYHQSLPGKLRSEDIAESILHALEAPPHVDINEILVRPTAQVR
jgi:NADP-dependent 3-hydroxy acid dehydrogenase YdfG